MNTLSHTLPSRISDEISWIRNVYQEHFDRSWFTSAFREPLMEPRQFQDIRHALSLTSPTIWDLPVLHRGVTALKIYTEIIRCSVLPKVKDIFGFSSMSFGYKDTSDSRLHRRLVVYTLPLNLDRLNSHIRELDRLLPPIPEEMPSIRTNFLVRAAV
ncbi:MAG: hypothetical protein J7L76_05915 [Spirochaetaceae bacterium]|nr:hypothetical protein [Spirochaetaceae bacterium]